MKFKRLLLASLWTIPICAYATPVELYGVIDIGLTHQPVGLPSTSNYSSSLDPYDKIPASGNPNIGPQTSLNSGPLQGNRLGIRGNWGLGDQWQAKLNLESGFDSVHFRQSSGADSLAANSGLAYPYATNGNSSLNGQTFNRAAWIGLAHDQWGEWRLGRNTTFTFDILGSLDPMLQSNYFSPVGYAGSLGGGMGSSDNTRQDRSIKYMFKAADWSAGLMYEAGNGTGVAPQGSGWGVMFNQKWQGLEFNASWQQARDALVEDVSVTPNALSVKAYNTVGYLLGVQYDLSADWRVKAGMINFTKSAATDSLSATDLSSTLYGYPLTYPTSGYGLSGNSYSYTGAAQNVRVEFIGASHTLSPELKFYSGLYWIQPQSYATYSGVLNTWGSMLLDYQLNTLSDTYAGFSRQTWSDTSGSANSPNNGYVSANWLWCLGYRLKF
jgi:predicted porin